jgi:hypothetical protein
MHEGDLLDWLSVAAVLAAALGAGLQAARAPHLRWRFVLLAAILAFLAVDDGFGAHERVTRAAGAALDVSVHGDVLFLVPYLPLLATAFFLLCTAARESTQTASRLISLGLVLLASAIGLRAMAALVSLSHVTLASWQQSIGVAALHAIELLAWISVAAGLALPPVLGERASSPPRRIRERSVKDGRRDRPGGEERSDATRTCASRQGAVAPTSGCAVQQRA